MLEWIILCETKLEFAKIIQRGPRKGSWSQRIEVRDRDDKEATPRCEPSVPTEASTSRASNRLLPVLGVLSIKEYPSSVREAKAIRVSASKRADL